MRRALVAISVVAAAAAGAWLFAARSGPGQGPRAPLTVSRPVVRDNEPQLQDEPMRDQGARTPKAVVQALIATGAGTSSAIPKGTRLLGLVVEGRAARVNLSAEFNALGEAGDTGESLAQNALRRALAQFPEVDRMTVEVDGKVYSGEHSGEWTDIPVRDAGAPDAASR